MSSPVMLKLLSDASPAIYSSPRPLNPEAAWNFCSGRRGGAAGDADAHLGTWLPSPEHQSCSSTEGRATNPWDAESQADDSAGKGQTAPPCPRTSHPAGPGCRRKKSTLKGNFGTAVLDLLAQHCNNSSCAGFREQGQ